MSVEREDIMSQAGIGATSGDRNYYWWCVLPLQSLLMTSYIMPLYGFNALIKPINELFAPGESLNGWPGAVTGGVIFLGVGFGGLLNWLVERVFRGLRLQWIVGHFLFCVCLVVGAFAGWLGSFWLLLLGCALPMGICVGVCFTQSMNNLLGWARPVKRVGLQSGIVGLMFGLWGAVFSLVAPYAILHWGFEWVLVGASIIIFLASLLSAFCLRAPPEAGHAEVNPVPRLSRRQLISAKPFWILLLFFLIFLTPGFGFKVIVQSLSEHVYHVTSLTASLVAAAFLLSYGFARLVCGLFADHVTLKPMFLLFAGGQSILLLVAAIGLPHIQSIVFLTVIMCLVGSLFAAGKSLWGMVMIALFGQANFHMTLTSALPSFAIAGLLGPITLNWALRSDDVMVTTSWWMYAMSGALALSTILFWILRRFDFDAFEKHHRQEIHFFPGARDEMDRF